MRHRRGSGSRATEPRSFCPLSRRVLCVWLPIRGRPALGRTWLPPRVPDQRPFSLPPPAQLREFELRKSEPRQEFRRLPTCLPTDRAVREVSALCLAPSPQAFCTAVDRGCLTCS